MLPSAATIAPEMEWTIPGRSAQTRVRTQCVRAFLDIRIPSLIWERLVFPTLPDDAEYYPYRDPTTQKDHSSSNEDSYWHIGHNLKSPFLTLQDNFLESNLVFAGANTLWRTCRKWLIFMPDKLEASQLALTGGSPSGSEESTGRAPGPNSRITSNRSPK